MPKTDEVTADRHPAARPNLGAVGSDAPVQKAQAVRPLDRTPPVEPSKPAGETRYLISDFCAYLDNYLPPEQVSECYRAYLFGAEAHEGQRRKSVASPTSTIRSRSRASWRRCTSTPGA
jgi:GTP diphosphokinase / guanosine-3',5'-bis(diphosphate) 3'-diphosphatase